MTISKTKLALGVLVVAILAARYKAELQKLPVIGSFVS